MHGIVVDAGKLRLIVGPVNGVEENIVGMSRHFVKAGGIAVHHAYIGRWIWSVIRLSDDRGVGHHEPDSVLSQISGDQRIVQTRDPRSHEVRRVEVAQVNRADRVSGIWV